MGILFDLFKELIKNKEEEKNKDYDKEDYQKELINEKRYEPYNFEEDLEEDDYFYEDEE